MELFPQTDSAGSLVQSWVGVKPPHFGPRCVHVAVRIWQMRSIGCVWSFRLYLYEAVHVWGWHWVSVCGRNHSSGCWRGSALSYRRTTHPDLSEWVCGQDFDDSAPVSLAEEWMCFLHTVWIWPCGWNVKKNKQRIWILAHGTTGVFFFLHCCCWRERYY